MIIAEQELGKKTYDSTLYVGIFLAVGKTWSRSRISAISFICFPFSKFYWCKKTTFLVAMVLVFEGALASKQKRTSYFWSYRHYFFRVAAWRRRLNLLSAKLAVASCFVGFWLFFTLNRASQPDILFITSCDRQNSCGVFEICFCLLFSWLRFIDYFDST